MLNVLYWLLVIELIGLAAFPFAFALMPCLRDRGYSVAKPLGLVLLSWPLWFLGSVHLIPTTSLTLWMALCLFSAAALWYARRRFAEMVEFVRREKLAILVGEGVFLLLFAAWVVYRLHDPSIDSTEQPMDFAFLNASTLAGFFPPEDPWLRGGDVPYYYFGYLMMGNLTELTFIPSRISYNLALALIPAMGGMAAFGLTYNLARAHGASALKGAQFALLAPILLLAVSNLEGILELASMRGWGGESFWQWVGIKDLGPAEVASWRPMEHLWWWRGTRVIDTLNAQGGSLDYTITEFPFFSFLLGDLHPHVMSIPFVLLFVSFSFNLLLSPARMGARWVRENPGTVLAAALLLGALAFVNAWDIVTFATLWAALLAFKAVRQEEGEWGRVLRLVWLPAAATLAPAILLYLPLLYQPGQPGHRHTAGGGGGLPPNPPSHHMGAVPGDHTPVPGSTASRSAILALGRLGCGASRLWGGGRGRRRPARGLRSGVRLFRQRVPAQGSRRSGAHIHALYHLGGVAVGLERA